jgi:uncharacterized protein YcgI (DUF1989 family)
VPSDDDLRRGDGTRHRWVIGLPARRAGDHVGLGAEMPRVVALSACPLESGDSSGGRSTPVRMEIRQAG